jgi:peptidoglycan/xylan/chitin deacetylase (PgdA/CDA1 family)
MPAAVFFYHRVANTYPNTWTISQRQFANHLRSLQSCSEVVSLAEIQRTQRDGQRSRLQTAITFDDGYEDNCHWALPELVARRLPVTYFVSTSFVESGESFPHDRAAGLPLRPNSVEQIRQWAEAGVEIGGHTHSHLDLGKDHPRSVLRREILDSRHRLQDWTGQPIRFFAFPYGLVENISQAAIDVVVEAGFEGFVSAYGAYNWAGEDGYHLQRIHGDPELSRFLNWLTLDPGKFHARSPLQYQFPPKRIQQDQPLHVQ